MRCVFNLLAHLLFQCACFSFFFNTAVSEFNVCNCNLLLETTYITATSILHSLHQVTEDVTVITAMGSKPCAVTVAGTCPVCLEDVSMNGNPLLAGIVPVPSLLQLESYVQGHEAGNPTLLSSLTGYHLDQALMDELVRRYLTNFSTRGVVTYLDTLLRMYADPSTMSRLSSDDFRRNLTVVLLALAMERERLDDGPAIRAAAAHLLGDPEPRTASNRAPFYACLACCTLDPDDSWYKVLVENLESILDPSFVLLVDTLAAKSPASLFSDSGIQDLIHATVLVQSRLMASIEDSKKRISPDPTLAAKRRLSSARDGVQHVSQANLDVTFKPSLFNMKRVDLQCVPSSSEKVSTLHFFENHA